MGEAHARRVAFHMLHLTASKVAIQGLGAERADGALPPPWLSRQTAEGGNNLTIIKAYKPCHAAIRPNSWQPICYDINVINVKSTTAL